MERILVGISGWTEPTLIAGGKFYPPPVKSAEARLRYYASQFSIVEVDSYYYGLLTELTSTLWVKRTPDHFVFDIKAFRLFTQHPTSPEVLPKDIRDMLRPAFREQNKIYNRDLPAEAVDELWKRFELSLRPLHDSGKLGVVLFQFPSWFYPGNESKEYISSFKSRLPNYRIAIEFRHASWVSEKNIERTMTFLKDNKLAYVCVDEPKGLNSGLPPVVAVTSNMSVIRFHGRNIIAWERENAAASGRFNYLYNEGELKEWQPRIKELAAKTRELHLIFNNCYDDKAVRNARQIRIMLGQLNATSSLFS